MVSEWPGKARSCRYADNEMVIKAIPRALCGYWRDWLIKALNDNNHSMNSRSNARW